MLVSFQSCGTRSCFHMSKTRSKGDGSAILYVVEQAAMSIPSMDRIENLEISRIDTDQSLEVLEYIDRGVSEDFENEADG